MTCGFWEEPAVEPYISSNPFNQPRPDKTHPTTFPDIEVKRLEEPTQPTKTSLQRDSKLRRCEGCIRVLSNIPRPDQSLPAKIYMARGLRSEAVSHDFAVFLLIIAQLEVAALPESKEAYKII